MGPVMKMAEKPKIDLDRFDRIFDSWQNDTCDEGDDCPSEIYNNKINQINGVLRFDFEAFTRGTYDILEFKESS